MILYILKNEFIESALYNYLMKFDDGIILNDNIINFFNKSSTAIHDINIVYRYSDYKEKYNTISIPEISTFSYFILNKEYCKDLIKNTVPEEFL